MLNARAEISLQLLGICTVFFRQRNDRLLVPFVNIYAFDLGWRRFLDLLLLYRMNSRLGRRRYCPAFVQTLGIGWIHGILMCVERVAQGELNLAFGTGQSKAFGIL